MKTFRVEDLECEEFYELMQAYRHIPIDLQYNEQLVEAYEDVKKYIAQLQVAAWKEAFGTAVAQVTWDTKAGPEFTFEEVIRVLQRAEAVEAK